jgi:hypothetical protein
MNTNTSTECVTVSILFIFVFHNIVGGMFTTLNPFLLAIIFCLFL